MKFFIDLWESEPVACIAAIDTILIVGTTFGMPLTVEQKTGIDAALAALGTLFARSRVTSPATVKEMKAEHRTALRVARGG